MTRYSFSFSHCFVITNVKPEKILGSESLIKFINVRLFVVRYSLGLLVTFEIN